MSTAGAAGQRFNPGEHLRQLRGRGGSSEYLDVKWRLVWLRSEHPAATIETEKLAGGAESKFAEFRARVSIPGGGSATGHGSETATDFGDFVEKAETKAIGRALAALGYGTQFVGDELDEGERIVDSPVERSPRREQPPPTPLKVEEWPDEQLLRALGQGKAEAQNEHLLSIYIGRATDRATLLARTRSALAAGPQQEAFKRRATHHAVVRGDELGLPRKAQSAPEPPLTEVVGEPEMSPQARRVALVWATARERGIAEEQVRAFGRNLYRSDDLAAWSPEQLDSFVTWLRSGSRDAAAG